MGEGVGSLRAGVLNAPLLSSFIGIFFRKWLVVWIDKFADFDIVCFVVIYICGKGISTTPDVDAGVSVMCFGQYAHPVICDHIHTKYFC